MARGSRKSRADLPAVSVIIPIAPGSSCELSLNSVACQEYDHSRIQILVAVGRHRSQQRNAALTRATGEVIWFMDNDVVIEDRTYLQRMVAHYADPETASVGGPSLTLPTDSLFQRAVGEVLGSYFATQSVRARYRPIGTLRRTSERELILCSQTFRRAFVDPHGFDARLHSGNEENELMNRLDRSGRTLLYDPSLRVYRSQRRTFREFVIQMAKYGKSRVEHFLIRPAAVELLFLVPLAFAIYLVLLPWLCVMDVPRTGRLVAIAPGALYLILAVLSAGAIMMRTGNPSLGALALPLFPVVHLGYAVGNVIGLVHRVFMGHRGEQPVQVYSLKPGSRSRPWQDEPRRSPNP